MIPVVGIYAFGWSAAVAVFNYWFERLNRTGCNRRRDDPRALREYAIQEGHMRHWSATLCAACLCGSCSSALSVCRLDRADSAPRSSPRQRIAPTARAFSGALVHFRLACSESFWRAFRMGYDTMADKELKQRRWDIYLLILRAVAMFFMARTVSTSSFVPLMALH